MAREDIIPLLRAQMIKVRSAAKTQREIGNDDTADHFDRVVIECENLIFEIAAMVISNPEISEGEIRNYLEAFYNNPKSL